MRRITAIALKLACACALVLALFPLTAAPARADETQGVTYSSYSMHAYREAAYGTPPDGIAGTEGCHFVIEAQFPGTLNITDAEAAARSFSLSGSIGSVSNISISAAGSTMTVDVTTSHLPGGDLNIKEATIQGVSCDGQPVIWPAFETIVPTGLKFHVTDVTVGTANTPASTTIEIDHSACIRSMNHILWTSNGTSLLTGSGAAQTTSAHHHNYWTFSLKDSASYIVQYSKQELAKVGYTVSTTADGYGVTLTASTPQAGQYLGIYNYDDDFLQANGLALGSSVSGLAIPTENTTLDLANRATISVDQDVAYTGSPVEPAVTVSDGRYGTLAKDTDYVVSYTDNTDIGTGHAIVSGIGRFSGSKAMAFHIARPLTKEQFTVDTSAVAYTGSAQKKTIDTSLVEGTDYVVSYYENAFPGTARIEISGIGDYMGTLVYTFEIKAANTPEEPDGRNTDRPATTTVKLTKPSITKIAALKKALKITWKATGANRYYIDYRVSGAKAWKTKTVNKASTKSLTIKKLKKGKRYQVRVTSYACSVHKTSSVKKSPKVK